MSWGFGEKEEGRKREDRGRLKSIMETYKC